MSIPSNIFGDNLVTREDPELITAKKMAMNQEQSMGKHGFNFYSDTSAHAGTFCAIQACEDTIIASVTGENISATNITIPAGFLMMGHVTSIQLTSGSILAYKSTS
jgi:hypothetical protein